MTENATASSNTSSKQFLLHQMYIKDLSFESPNSPDVFKQVDAEMETSEDCTGHRRSAGGGHAAEDSQPLG